MAKGSQDSGPLPFVALFVAWLIPGAGHVYVGRLWRGVVIFVTISALFWTGVAMGGVMTVDVETERWWFVADMLTGIHGLIGWYRHHQVAMDYARKPEIGEPVSGDSPAATSRREAIEEYLANKGVALVAPTETVARTYAGVAGLLNLMCVFDAVVLSLMGVRGEPAPPRERREGRGRRESRRSS
ncbi:MAG: hypothetical protein AMK72_11065 [Planctomycetes bacterium SM23_25]|nr:MAG: hypothetical protein AMK72_11065 [Planctomycetes bacterium SM23_25]